MQSPCSSATTWCDFPVDRSTVKRKPGKPTDEWHSVGWAAVTMQDRCQYWVNARDSCSLPSYISVDCHFAYFAYDSDGATSSNVQLLFNSISPANRHNLRASILFCAYNKTKPKRANISQFTYGEIEKVREGEREGGRERARERQSVSEWRQNANIMTSSISTSSRRAADWLMQKERLYTPRNTADIAQPLTGTLLGIRNLMRRLCHRCSYAKRRCECFIVIVSNSRDVNKGGSIICIVISIRFVWPVQWDYCFDAAAAACGSYLVKCCLNILPII